MEQGEIVVSSGRAYKVEVISVPTRTASARVKDGRIVIRVPQMLRGSAADEMLEDLKRRMVRSLEKHPERFEYRKFSITQGQGMTALGRHFVIDACEAAGRYSTACIDGGVVRVRLAAGLGQEERGRALTKLAVRCISRSLLPELAQRVERINIAHFNAGIGGTRIRNNSTRWGSYSARSRRITINFRLLLAPEEILDYVIIHELAHARVSNHSRRFWKLVGSVLPDYRDRRRWLRINGDRLGQSQS